MARKPKTQSHIDPAIVAEELLQFIEQLEGCAQEKKGIAEREKEILAEMKGRGYDTKAAKTLVKLRAADPEKVAEEETILELYKNAVGM
ncbi:DUF2312 domain-containing protein [Cereibacter sphaeroides]|uniref:DUF2312 domain-containing protein n=1 Tax=Cereibacter sphaeroides TaxID=1063 RepID=UPI001F2A91C0|nr:GapR family DNA-binding domain-containing protein [Cereibacter sphaeroides]MCE6957716.1 DUF2312 domain-containing protein [Cereibacter sphaeroides]MCE6971502.1 DUF2312 domain-containing protein [Cereibacter sphaeroides]